MSVLVAGVGNLFLGDDGFGCEVARRLAGGPLPSGVEVSDFGIRGLHLAYRLLDPVSLLVVVDAVARGGPPGTLYLLEPALEPPAEPAAPDAHGLDLPAVFAALRALGGELPVTRIVGCEPASVDERLGLSPRVEASVEDAVRLVREVIGRQPGAARRPLAAEGRP